MKIILRANVPTERWLFAFTLRGTSSVALRQVATGFLRSHPLPSGGSGASKASTVWRQVATSDRWLPATGGYRKHTGNGASIAIFRPNVGCRNCIRWACKTYPASPGKPGSSTMPPPGPYTGSPKRGWPTEARWILIWCGRPVMIWTEHSVSSALRCKTFTMLRDAFPAHEAPKISPSRGWGIKPMGVRIQIESKVAIPCTTVRYSFCTSAQRLVISAEVLRS